MSDTLIYAFKKYKAGMCLSMKMKEFLRSFSCDGVRK
jgi:hypothetical protein